MIKKIFLSSMIAGLAIGCLLYGYKLGFKDSATLTYFSNAGIDYAHLKILREKGVDRLREFIEADLDLVVSIHKNLGEQQSFFSHFVGPESERKANREHYLNYYRGILEYKNKYPSKDKQSEVLSELVQLINQLREK